jgi:hypothetical protein
MERCWITPQVGDLEVASLDEAMADMERKGVAVDGPISPAPH